MDGLWAPREIPVGSWQNSNQLQYFYSGQPTTSSPPFLGAKIWDSLGLFPWRKTKCAISPYLCGVGPLILQKTRRFPRGMLGVVASQPINLLLVFQPWTNRWRLLRIIDKTSWRHMCSCSTHFSLVASQCNCMACVKPAARSHDTLRNNQSIRSRDYKFRRCQCGALIIRLRSIPIPPDFHQRGSAGATQMWLVEKTHHLLKEPPRLDHGCTSGNEDWGRAPRLSHCGPARNARIERETGSEVQTLDGRNVDGWESFPCFTIHFHSASHGVHVSLPTPRHGTWPSEPAPTQSGWRVGWPLRPTN